MFFLHTKYSWPKMYEVHLRAVELALLEMIFSRWVSLENKSIHHSNRDYDIIIGWEEITETHNLKYAVSDNRAAYYGVCPDTTKRFLDSFREIQFSYFKELDHDDPNEIRAYLLSHLYSDHLKIWLSIHARTLFHRFVSGHRIDSNGHIDLKFRSLYLKDIAVSFLDWTGILDWIKKEETEWLYHDHAKLHYSTSEILERLTVGLNITDPTLDSEEADNILNALEGLYGVTHPKYTFHEILNLEDPKNLNDIFKFSLHRDYLVTRQERMCSAEVRLLHYVWEKSTSMVLEGSRHKDKYPFEFVFHRFFSSFPLTNRMVDNSSTRKIKARMLTLAIMNLYYTKPKDDRRTFLEGLFNKPQFGDW